MKKINVLYLVTFCTFLPLVAGCEPTKERHDQESITGFDQWKLVGSGTASPKLSLPKSALKASLKASVSLPSGRVELEARCHNKLIQLTLHTHNIEIETSPFHFGSTQRWAHAFTVALANNSGEIIEFKRGRRDDDVSNRYYIEDIQSDKFLYPTGFLKLRTESKNWIFVPYSELLESYSLACGAKSSQ